MQSFKRKTKPSNLIVRINLVSLKFYDRYYNIDFKRDENKLNLSQKNLSRNEYAMKIK